jgi:hypothetical protein
MTNAFKYVFFARAYALVLGFSAIALLCWQWATEGRCRVPALVGLCVSLAAAVSSHYYAVLSIFPLGLGEVVRSIRRKKIDAGIWLALGLSLFPLLLFLPLIESARKFAPHFWTKPHWSSIIFYYPYSLLSPSAVPLLLIFLVIVSYTAFFRPDSGVRGPRVGRRIPVHELAAVVGFLLIPAVETVLAKTVVGAYEDRCALAAVIGLSIAVAWGLYSALDAKLAPAFGLGLLLIGFLVARQVHTFRREAVVRSDRTSSYVFLEAHARGPAPIVISNPQSFAELTYHSPQDVGPRLLYLADPRMGIQHTGTNDLEQGLMEMKHWAGLNVQPFHAFVASGQECYILFFTSDYPHNFDWIIPALSAAHWKITLLSWQDGKILFLAGPDGNAKFPAGAH